MSGGACRAANAKPGTPVVRSARSITLIVLGLMVGFLIDAISSPIFGPGKVSLPDPEALK